mgnify:CR=1 FL=1
MNKYNTATIYIIINAVKHITKFLTNTFLIFILFNNFIINGTNKNASKKPNEGVNILEKPDVKFENTGIPINPIKIYINIINWLSTKGKISASSKTTSTCNVNDISDKGIDIYELTINSAKNILSIAIRLIVISYPKILNSNPAATAEPITPATFGPIACINK